MLIALHSLLRRKIDTYLTIIGSGSEEPRLRHWINRLGIHAHVRLIGQADFSVIKNLLSISHAYVQSSISEGLSNALAEAMAWGCPVFGTAVGGTPEVIRDGENGFLLPPSHPEEWADKLELARDRSLMMRIRKAAYKTACRLFAIESHANKFMKFYKRSINIDRSGNMNSPALNVRKVNIYTEESYFPRTETHKILLWGKLEWYYGFDLFIKEIAPILRAKNNIQCAIVGNGSQEDELRYLSSFLGILKSVSIVSLSPNDCEDIQVQNKWYQWADIIIDTPRFARDGGVPVTGDALFRACRKTNHQ